MAGRKIYIYALYVSLLLLADNGNVAKATGLCTSGLMNTHCVWTCCGFVAFPYTGHSQVVVLTWEVFIHAQITFCNKFGSQDGL